MFPVKSASVNRKILLPAAVMTTILISAIGTILGYNQYRSLDSAIHAKAGILGSLIRRISAFHVMNFDYEPLQMIADETLKDRDVRYAVFYDENMQPISDAALRLSETAPDIFVKRFEIKDSGQKTIAWFEIGISRSSLSDNLYSSITITGLSIGISLLFLVAGITWLLSRTVIRPLQKIVTASGEITEKGDLRARFENKPFDEIGQLGDSLNSMCRKIEKIIQKSSEISQGLASSSSQEAASVQTTSAALEEISSMNSRTWENIRQTEQYMKTAGEICSSSDADMKKLAEAMAEVREKSNEITTIIQTIDQIAFQTNLLALNASVEAARAGESGAGFSVVANEVRNLAVQAGNSVKDSTALIHDTVTKIYDVGELVKKAGDAFAGLSRITMQVSGLSENTAAAYREQVAGMEHIHKSIEEISIISQENAARAVSLQNEIGWFTTG